MHLANVLEEMVFAAKRAFGQRLLLAREVVVVSEVCGRGVVAFAEGTAAGEGARAWTADPELFGHVDCALVPEPFDAVGEALLAEGAEEALAFAGLALDGGGNGGVGHRRGRRGRRWRWWWSR